MIRISRKLNISAGTGAVATGTSPVEVHYGLSRRAIKEICSTWDSHFRPTPRLISDAIFWKFIFKYNVLLDNGGRCV